MARRTAQSLQDSLIQVSVVPHARQRYPTVGDWFVSLSGDLNIVVSRMRDRRSEIGVIVHEMVEALLCEHAGVTAEMVDAFDFEWEGQLKEGEPGDSPRAPYHREHLLAMKIERLVVEAMGLDWRAHEHVVEECEMSAPTSRSADDP